MNTLLLACIFAALLAIAFAVTLLAVAADSIVESLADIASFLRQRDDRQMAQDALEAWVRDRREL